MPIFQSIAVATGIGGSLSQSWVTSPKAKRSQLLGPIDVEENGWLESYGLKHWQYGDRIFDSLVQLVRFPYSFGVVSQLMFP